MTLTETKIKGLFVIEPKVWRDGRGYFYESYNEKEFSKAGIKANFVQDNQSLSQKGALRGLHAQQDPSPQGKLVRVIRGRVIDVAIDIRKSSPTYGQHIAVELSEDNHKMFWVPPGFLHGFLTLEDNTIFTYKVTNPYDKASEIGVRWNDEDLNIIWGIDASEVILSEKDKELPLFKDFVSPF
ncbi:dTDP-4-dehydrorhamnose 3,5-epimerase [Daejeonella lutea]|uniref:dTDP-4-dehydrorhamnose 3,5-epimerase n=1 Tax=Daejeonella lutea TaxID=572036 RepID=A0A1T5D068_9SPHI|nr:dTDP-4-dehydrorhamnose 3,5-epimerase [Daejeonella lutea]SKB65104.1 dTDP-4-dehydrorhamnose 3,5-epimerase [Daejeonella lutea]